MTDPIEELRSIRRSLTPSESETLTAKIIAIIDVFEDGTIDSASQPAHILFGRMEGELVGMSIHDLIPDRDGMRDRHRSHFSGFWKSPVPRSMGRAIQGRLVGLRKDGTEFGVAVILYPFVHARVPRCRAIVVPLP